MKGAYREITIMGTSYPSYRAQRRASARQLWDRGVLKNLGLVGSQSEARGRNIPGVKTLIVFDLDGTLAPSKGALDDEMAQLLVRLLGVVKVAIISGGDFPQFEAQVLGRLPSGQQSG